MDFLLQISMKGTYAIGFVIGQARLAGQWVRRGLKFSAVSSPRLFPAPGCFQTKTVSSARPFPVWSKYFFFQSVQPRALSKPKGFSSPEMFPEKRRFQPEAYHPWSASTQIIHFIALSHFTSFYPTVYTHANELLALSGQQISWTVEERKWIQACSPTFSCDTFSQNFNGMAMGFEWLLRSETLSGYPVSCKVDCSDWKCPQNWNLYVLSFVFALVTVEPFCNIWWFQVHSFDVGKLWWHFRRFRPMWMFSEWIHVFGEIFGEQ